MGCSSSKTVYEDAASASLSSHQRDDFIISSAYVSELPPARTARPRTQTEASSASLSSHQSDDFIISSAYVSELPPARTARPRTQTETSFSSARYPPPKVIKPITRPTNSSYYPTIAPIPPRNNKFIRASHADNQMAGVLPPLPGKPERGKYPSPFRNHDKQVDMPFPPDGEHYTHVPIYAARDEPYDGTELGGAVRAVYNVNDPSNYILIQHDKTKKKTETAEVKAKQHPFTTLTRVHRVGA